MKNRIENESIEGNVQTMESTKGKYRKMVEKKGS
jgi:hypothetical protein